MEHLLLHTALEPRLSGLGEAGHVTTPGVSRWLRGQEGGGGSCDRARDQPVSEDPREEDGEHGAQRRAAAQQQAGEGGAGRRRAEGRGGRVVLLLCGPPPEQLRVFLTHWRAFLTHWG